MLSSRNSFNFHRIFGTLYLHCTNTFGSSLGYQDIEVVNGGEIETKIVYLVKGHLIRAQLQYDGKWGMGLNVAKKNYYGNKSAL